MSRFIVTSGSNFKPFSYDELMKPLQASAEVHAATADAYDQLSMETEALGRYISENEDDEQARAIYNGYLNKLNALEENLWNNGFNAQTRRDLSSARAGYAGDVKRLQTAIETRQKRSDEYWKYRHEHPELVAGFDPGASGLDNYLTNSEFGKNWFSYNGNQFANEVATDLSARVNDLQKSYINSGMKVPGYLEYVIDNGFSNKNVANGEKLARLLMSGANYDASKFDEVDRMVADVLVNHLQSTGANPGEGGNLSADEFNRLIGYGVYGATQAIKEPKRQMLADKNWEKQMQFALATHNSNLRRQEEALKAAMQKPASYDTSLQDIYTPGGAGENYEKARKKMVDLFGDDNKLYRSSDGQMVRGGAAASELVYSGQLRRDKMAEIGFDIGLDPNHLAQKNYLHGTVTKNGVKYETRYNPIIEKMQYRVAGSTDAFKTSNALTKTYKDARKQYEDTLKYYRRNDKELFNAAKMNPDKQHELYDEIGLGFENPMTSYRDAYMSQPGNQAASDASAIWMVRAGTDGDYLDRFAGWLSNSILVNDDGKAEKDKNAREHDDTGRHVHKMGHDLIPEKKTVSDLNDVFTFDNKGRINNISGYLLDENAILNNYIIVKTSKGDYSIGLDMFDSNLLNSMFQDSANVIQTILRNPNMSDYEKRVAMRNEVSRLSRNIKSRIGYDLNLQSQGPTNKDDNN
jgi:hypothetical protein